MSQPDRIFEGLARTLEEAVLPSVNDGFARGQLFAVLEVLGGLQGQVHWGGMLLENEAANLSSLLDEAAGLVDGDLRVRMRAFVDSPAAPLAERLEAGRALVCELIEGGHGDDGPLAASIDSFLSNDAIFKAMALRPSRLGEISQG